MHNGCERNVRRDEGRTGLDNVLKWHIIFDEDTTDISKVFYDEKEKLVVVVFRDGKKVMQRCKDGDIFNIKIGIALCIAIKKYGNFETWFEEREKDGTIKKVSGKRRKQKSKEKDSFAEGWFNKKSDKSKWVEEYEAEFWR